MKWHNLRETSTALLVEIIYLHLANLFGGNLSVVISGRNKSSQIPSLTFVIFPSKSEFS